MRTYPRPAVLGASAALVLGGALAGGLPALAGTGTSDGGALVLTIPNQVVRPGCARYPLAYGVTAADGEQWRLTTSAEGPQDPSALETGTGSATGVTTLRLCAPGAVGRYSVHGSLENLATGVTVTASTTFDVVRAAARVSAVVEPRRARTGALVTVSGRAGHRVGTAFRDLRGARIAVQYRAVGTSRWSTLRSVTAPTGAYRLRWRFTPRTSVQVRATLRATATTVAASSTPVLLTRVAPALPAPPPSVPVVRYANCDALNARHPHGVGIPGARDRTSGTPVTTFLRHAALYQANTARDRDKDRIACERR